MPHFILYGYCVFAVTYALYHAARLVNYCAIINATLNQGDLPKKEMKAVQRILDWLLLHIAVILLMVVVNTGF